VSTGDSPALIAILCVVAIGALWTAYNGGGVKHGIGVGFGRAEHASRYRYSRTGRVCLFLIAILLLGRAASDIIRMIR
jgi:hypothetical protein